MADDVARTAATRVTDTLAAPLLRCMRAWCPDVGKAVIERRGLGLSPRQLIATLPSLGKLLYLSLRQHDSLPEALPAGLLADEAELMPLLQFRQLQAASLITVEGPCEWIECLDRHGHARARLYLLPDSDYLAWDGMHAHADSNSARAPVQTCLDGARVVQFRHCAWAGMQLLSVDTCLRISPLSCRVATQIVRSEVVSGGLVKRP